MACEVVQPAAGILLQHTEAQAVAVAQALFEHAEVAVAVAWLDKVVEGSPVRRFDRVWLPAVGQLCLSEAS